MTLDVYHLSKKTVSEKSNNTGFDVIIRRQSSIVGKYFFHLKTPEQCWCYVVL